MVSLNTSAMGNPKPNFLLNSREEIIYPTQIPKWPLHNHFSIASHVHGMSFIGTHFLRDHAHGLCTVQEATVEGVEWEAVEKVKANVIRSLPLRTKLVPLTSCVNLQITFNETFPMFGPMSLLRGILTRRKTSKGQLQLWGCQKGYREGVE